MVAHAHAAVDPRAELDEARLIPLHWMIAGLAGFFIIGGQFLLNNVCAHAYPAEVRGTGEGLMPRVGRIGGILGPHFGGWLLGWFGGNSAALFVAVTVATGTGAVAVIALRSEGPARTGAPRAALSSAEEMNS